MSRFKIINLFDKIFVSVSVFLIVYAWINFFIRDLISTFVLSLIFSSAIIFLLYYILNRHIEKKNKSKTYLKDVEEKFLAFRLLKQDEQINLLKSIIEKTCETQNENKLLVFNRNNKKHQILFAFMKEKLSQFDLVNMIQNTEKDVEVLKIICCNTEPNLNTKILKNLEIEIITKNKLYDEYFLPHNIFPNCSNLNTKPERKKLKELMRNFFVPSKAKSYFLCGLILIFSSIILPFHYYYLIFGSTLLIFSIVCKLQPFFKR